MAGSARRRLRDGRLAAGRRSVPLGLAVAVFVWAALLHARNEPDAPGHLIIEPNLLSKLQLLAGGLHTEIVLCLQGTTEGETAHATEFSMPEQQSSTSKGSVSLPCPRETLAVWHNHPVVDPELLTASPHIRWSRRGPLDLCALSGQDILTADRVGYPFVVVAVDAETWCWWTREQVQDFVRQRIDRGHFSPGQIHAGARSDVTIRSTRVRTDSRIQQLPGERLLN